MLRSNIKFFLAFSVAAVLLVVFQTYAVWQDAPAAPAQYGTTPGTTQDDYKPVNLGSFPQAKLGGFTIGTSTPLSTDMLQIESPIANAGIVFSRGGAVIGGILANSVNQLNIQSLNQPIRFSTNGFVNEHMRIATNGNVGIGTVTPYSKLQIDMQNLQTTEGLYISSDNFPNNHYSYLNIEDISSGSAVPIFKVHQSGNVGIGTTGPVEKLEVIGTIRQAGTSADGLTGIHIGDSAVRLFQTNDGNKSLGIYTNSTEKMRILGNGNVGIGTTNPGYKLDIQDGQINASGGLCINNDCKPSWTAVTGGAGVPTLDSVTTNGSSTANDIMVQGARASIFYDRQDPNYFLDPANSGTSAILAGNVGIGTTNPGAQLHIGSGSGSQGILIQSGGIGGNYVKFDAPVRDWQVGSNLAVGGDNFEVFDATANINRFLINSSGNVGIGTTGPVEKLEVIGTIRQAGTSADGLTGIHIGDSAVRLFQTNDGNKSLGIYTNSTEKMRILGNGNVGIGTTNPGYKLDVAGTLNATTLLEGGVAVQKRGNMSCASGNFIQSISSNGDVTCNPDQTGSGADGLGSGNSGTANYLTKWIGGTSIGNSVIYDNGNIGIGDSSPSALLTIGNGDLFQITSSGYARGPNGWAGSPTFSFAGDPNTGIYTTGDNANTIAFSTFGSEKARISANGRFVVYDILNTLASVDTNGSWTWTNVVNYSSGAVPGPINPSWQFVTLDSSKPVLGIRLSGSSDDGGKCLANINAYFAGAVTNVGYLTDLDLDGTNFGTYSGSGAGSMATREFIFDDLSNGRSSLTSVSFTDNSYYNKALGLNYIPPGQILWYDVFAADGASLEYVNCIIDVLYGTSY